MFYENPKKNYQKAMVYFCGSRGNLRQAFLEKASQVDLDIEQRKKELGH